VGRSGLATDGGSGTNLKEKGEKNLIKGKKEGKKLPGHFKRNQGIQRGVAEKNACKGKEGDLKTSWPSGGTVGVSA